MRKMHLLSSNILALFIIVLLSMNSSVFSKTLQVVNLSTGCNSSSKLYQVTDDSGTKFIQVNDISTGCNSSSKLYEIQSY